MILAGEDVAQIRQLIERGARSDETFPRSVGYLLTTTVRDRSFRAGKIFLFNKDLEFKQGLDSAIP